METKSIQRNGNSSLLLCQKLESTELFCDDFMFRYVMPFNIHESNDNFLYVMSGRTHALNDASDQVFFVMHKLEAINNRHISLVLLMDF